VGLEGEGLAGLERQYDEQLRGRTADVGVLRDARGRPLSTGDILPVTSLEGDNVYLTIDAAIQHDAEEILAQAVAQYQAASGMAVVLDPRTGALLALAVVPTFNPNDAGKAPAASRRNRVITDVFEPGSTLKPLIVASALDRGVIQVDQEIFCEDGAIPIGKHVIRDTHPHGLLDIGGVIAKSSNIGALKIGMELGADQLHQELQRWGLGARTGIELPGEVKGMLASPKRWSKARIATISFGQGVGVTALQLTAAVAAIADQGRWRAPYVVSRVVAQDGSVRTENKGSAPRQVVRPETARAMARMMERVVQPGGTGIRASLPGIRVAGKTGTAQKVDPVAGGYSADKRISSFVGFAPAEDPRAVVVVVVDEPRGATYGGVVAGPAFREIMRSTLRNLGINVAAEQVAQSAPAQPSGGSKTLSDAPETSAISVRTPEVRGAEIELDAMPDLRGLDARRAAARLLAAGLELQLEGRGRVVEQEPAPGASLEGVSSARLLLAQGRG
jgi:cell division protein FtsI (penicillin-binding protein 3)